MTTVVWFRDDLRVIDNPALSASAARVAYQKPTKSPPASTESDLPQSRPAAGKPHYAGGVLPVYILSESDARADTAAQVYRHYSLVRLSRLLDGRLLIFCGDAADILTRICRATGADAVYCNRRHTPDGRREDDVVGKKLSSASVAVKFFDAASLLHDSEKLRTQSGQVYKVFTPFYRRLLEEADGFRALIPAPDNIVYADVPAAIWRQQVALPPARSNASSLSQTRAAASKADYPPPAWGEKIMRYWTGGADSASIIARAAAVEPAYDQRRDYPAIENGTSKISPRLRFGEVSPHEIWHSIGRRDSSLLRQLVWREFCYYLLHHFPDLPVANWRRQFDAFPWRDGGGEAAADLRRWQRGETGFPIIDAGMRELWETGYMHNRVRMLAASFLTKNLRIHWRAGAAWFMHCLVDADLANNSAGWQWVAGSGADAAPYFRIFNPVIQSKKFDAAGDYIRRFVPELRAMSSAHIHEPWLRGGAPGYPAPMADLGVTRAAAVAAHAALTSKYQNKQSHPV